MKYGCYYIRISRPIFIDWSFFNDTHVNHHSKEFFHFITRNLEIYIWKYIDMLKRSYRLPSFLTSWWWWNIIKVNTSTSTVRSNWSPPYCFFFVFVTIILLFFNPPYIGRKPRMHCIFWYINVEHQLQFRGSKIY
jgi:hypothetical protein